MTILDPKAIIVLALVKAPVDDAMDVGDIDAKRISVFEFRKVWRSRTARGTCGASRELHQLPHIDEGVEIPPLPIRRIGFQVAPNVLIGETRLRNRDA